jgi:hypothetical protein
MTALQKFKRHGESIGSTNEFPTFDREWMLLPGRFSVFGEATIQTNYSQNGLQQLDSNSENAWDNVFLEQRQESKQDRFLRVQGCKKRLLTSTK